MPAGRRNWISGGQDLNDEEITDLVEKKRFHAVGFRSRRFKADGSEVPPILKLISHEKLLLEHQKHEMPVADWLEWLRKLNLKAVTNPAHTYVAIGWRTP